MTRHQPNNRQRHHLLLRWVVLPVVAALLCTAGWTIYQRCMTSTAPLSPEPVVATADPTVNEAPIPQATINNYRVPATHPRYISIPALGATKARVIAVGLTKAGALDTPRNIGDTAWYTKSAYPGQGSGSVLIDGHNGGISRDGVFYGLDKLKVGDAIIIERGDGTQVRYTVTENRTESLKEANATGMTRLLTPYDPTKEGLGLITCAGNWSPRDRLFDKRILVRAVAQ